MKNRMFRKIVVTTSIIGALLIGGTGCGGAFTSDADTANENINKAAEQFEVNRKIIFYNGITDKIVATVEGRCSIERDGEKIQAICKIGPDQFSRDELGLSDNMTYFAIQTDPIDVNVYRKRVIIKPQGVIPDFDLVIGEDK